MEKILLLYLRNVVDFLEARLKLTKAMREYYIEGKALKVDPYRYANDPIQNFKLMKRLSNEWVDIYTYVRDDPVAVVDKEFSGLIGNFSFPSYDDLREVVNDYLEFQRTKNIPVKALASGDHPGAKFKTPLRSSDCHAIASYCIYDPEKIQIALDWLREAHVRFDKNKDLKEYKRSLTLDLAFALSETGHTKEAVKLTGRLARTFKFNDVHFIDMHLYHKARHENRATGDMRLGISPTDTSLELPLLTPFREEYQIKVCNRNYSLPPSYLAKLKCRYLTKNSPLFILSPLKEEELYLKPKITVYRQFLTDSEVDRMINASYGQMEESEAHVYPAQIGQTVSRAGHSSFIPSEDPNFEYLLKRTDELTGLSNETTEEIQVTYYDAGGYFTPHYEALPIDWLLPPGNRLTTVIYYLSDKQVGGETALYDLNVLVEPEKGSALVLDNMDNNGLIDIFSAYGDCPVLYGHQWMANRWYYSRGQVFHRRCALTTEE